MELLRFMTAGSVDDGKSTLIGRLFYETGNIHEDLLTSISKDGLNLAHFTDGLKEEREKGITIDVAYRYYETPHKKFIVADAPGHKEFTRNMVTALTQSDAVLILADASRGITEQTKRHLFLAEWIGTKHLVVLVNKMDLVNFDEKIFLHIKSQLSTNKNITYIPISALHGDNILKKSEQMKWYAGATLNDWLHQKNTTRHIISNENDVFFTIQTAKDKNILGTLKSGKIKVGDTLLLNNGNLNCTVKNIYAWPESLTTAQAGSALRIETDQVLSRGDFLVSKNSKIEKTKKCQLQWCYLLEDTLPLQGNYILKFESRETKIKEIHINQYFDLNQGKWISHKTDHMTMNTIYNGEFSFTEETYLLNDGNFAIIDADSAKTIAAGKVIKL